MADYRVQNHAFGGSKDTDLVKFADQILYPYDPAVVFFQTGSNDYVMMKGTDEEKAAKCMAYKKQMFHTFQAAGCEIRDHERTAAPRADTVP